MPTPLFTCAPGGLAREAGTDRANPTHGEEADVPLSGILKRDKDASYRLIISGQEVRRPNPLPESMPGLHKGAPRDGYKNLEALQADLEEAVADVLHAMRLPRERFRKTALYNCTEIIKMPPIYGLLCHLRSRDLVRLAANSHRLAAAVQACACYGQSAMVDDLQQCLMPVLLGVYARHVGVQVLRDKDITTLRTTRKFDISDPAQREQRAEFLSQYSDEADRIGVLSRDRIEQIADPPDAEDPALRIVLDVARYGSRLVGRAASQMDRNAEQEIHRLAAYVSTVHAQVSAQAATGKRMPLILAEAWERYMQHRKREGLEKTARHNIYALDDLFATCRCRVLEFFQGGSETVIYAEPERIYVRRIPDAEGQMRWSCFRTRADAANRSRERRASSMGIKQNFRNDPADEELIPISGQLGDAS